ncbi:MAG: PadR family transcriptional regulator [Candidatus Bathyarchaeia archaeon]
MVKISNVFLRGLEKPIILWLLAHKPRHGYELIVEFRKLTGRKLKPSIVYPFLHRLEKGGFASAEWITKGKKRVRHYALTKKGEDLLRKVKEIFSKPLNQVFVDLIERKKSLAPNK